MGAPLIKPIVLEAATEEKQYINIPNIFAADMAQSRFFKVRLSTPEKDITNIAGMDCLPVKNISYTVTGIETMNLPIGVFRDIPIPIGKRLPRISMTLVDNRIDVIESQLRAWYVSMIPSKQGTIGYLDQMVGSLTYESYDTSGNTNFTYSAFVMLSEDFSMSRDYEANELKSMEISLIVLKDTVTTDGTPLAKVPKPEPLSPPKPPEAADKKFVAKAGVPYKESAPRTPTSI